MKKRCTPQEVRKAYQKIGKWRMTAEALNNSYGVSLHFATRRDYATGRRDITAPETRARLLLGPRVCPGCGRRHITRKQAKPKRIRVSGYPVEKVKTFIEVIELREPMQ